MMTIIYLVYENTIPGLYNSFYSQRPTPQMPILSVNPD